VERRAGGAKTVKDREREIKRAKIERERLKEQR